MLDRLRRLLGLSPRRPPPSRPAPSERPVAPPAPEPGPPARTEPDPPPPPPVQPELGRSVRVHADRLDDRPAPRPLTPSEALRLAREGPVALERGPEGE